jgi:hypothetical protein
MEEKRVFKRRTDRFIALKEDDAAALVTRGKVVSCGIKFDSGDDIRCGIVKKSACVKGRVRGTSMTPHRMSEKFDMESDVPSVMSSTSPLSPKHCANRQPPDPEGSSMVKWVTICLLC